MSGGHTSCTVQDSASTRSGNVSAIPVNLLSSASAILTVCATVVSGSTSGNADHLVPALPGAAYVFANPNATASAGMALGIGLGARRSRWLGQVELSQWTMRPQAVVFPPTS